MLNVRETNTIYSTLKLAINTLNDSGIESPNIEAETLLAYVLSCNRVNLHANSDRTIKHEDFTAYQRLIKERASHIPLQYITGHVEFMSLDFVVDENVLIPRPETEILVEAVINKVKSKSISNKIVTIVDIGTGSGNISVSLAVYLKNVQLFASDISKNALAVARINAQSNKVTDKVFLLRGNLFEAFDNHLEKGSVDFIVSNPPYVKESEWNELELEIRNHEPTEALVGGKDGLYYCKQIIKEAPEWLKAKGHLIMEVGNTQAKTIKSLIEREGHFEDIEIFRDLQTIERIVMARRKEQNDC